MRQLVSVVSDGALRYFLHDGGEAIQVAQLVDPGVDVGAVIEIGVSLGSLYSKMPVDGLVGGQVKPAKPAKEVAPAPAALPPSPPEPKVKYARTNVTVEEIIDYITKHPGVRTTMIAAELMPGPTRPGTTKPRQTVDNKLRNLVSRHAADGTEAPVHKRQLGPMHVGWYPGPAPVDEVVQAEEVADLAG